MAAARHSKCLASSPIHTTAGRISKGNIKTHRTAEGDTIRLHNDVILEANSKDEGGTASRDKTGQKRRRQRQHHKNSRCDSTGIKVTNPGRKNSRQMEEKERRLYQDIRIAVDVRTKKI